MRSDKLFALCHRRMMQVTSARRSESHALSDKRDWEGQEPQDYLQLTLANLANILS